MSFISFSSLSCFHISIVIGLEEAQYTLNENNTVYMRRLRLLAPPNNVLFARPRLRLNGIPGTASCEWVKHLVDSVV